MCFKHRSKEAKASLNPGGPLTGRAFAFPALPRTLDDFLNRPEADLSDPFRSAALTILALSIYSIDQPLCFKALAFLKGPFGLSNEEKAAVAAAMAHRQSYIPFSFYEGATPENNYRANQPYTVVIQGLDKPGDEDEVTLYVQSSGAQTLRSLTLKRSPEGLYLLLKADLLGPIIAPKRDNPWA